MNIDSDTYTTLASDLNMPMEGQTVFFLF